MILVLIDVSFHWFGVLLVLGVMSGFRVKAGRLWYYVMTLYYETFVLADFLWHSCHRGRSRAHGHRKEGLQTSAVLQGVERGLVPNQASTDISLPRAGKSAHGCSPDTEVGMASLQQSGGSSPDHPLDL